MINKITISQSNDVEQVNSVLIDNIYNTVKAIIDKDNNKNNTYLKGNLNSSVAYKDAVDYLRSNFSNLMINIVDNKYYIRFEDNEVFNVLMNELGYGDGVGITTDEAANILFNLNFKNNTNITSFNELIYFTKQITGNYALQFDGCTNLQCIDLSNNKYANSHLCHNCQNLEYFHGRNSTKGLLDLSNITSNFVDTYSFKLCKKLEHVILGSHINQLNKFCFQSCSALFEINIENITLFGEGCFEGCTSFTSIDISSAIGIGYHAFSGCSNLTTVISTNSITTISRYAFYNCTKLVDGPDCSNLSGELAGSVFENCYALKTINLTDKITSIGDDALWSCTSLEDVGDVSNVTKLVDRAFHNCKNLTSLNFTNKFTSIPSSSFYGCEKLTSFGDLSGLTGDLGGGAFQGCKAITGEFNTNGFGNSTITSIGSSAFENCTGLTIITIPETVTYIYKDAFYNCYALQSIYFKSLTPPTLHSQALRQNNAILYVPAEALSDYQNADVWSTIYINRIQAYYPS